MPASTYQLVLDAAARWPDAPATRWIPDPAAYTRCLTWTYAELAARVTRTANALTALGVRRQDAITLCGANTSTLYATTLAAEAVAIAAPVDPALRAERIVQLVRRTGSRFLVAAGPELDADVWRTMLDVARETGMAAVLALRPDGADGPPPPLLPGTDDETGPGAAGGPLVAYLDDVAAGHPADRLVGATLPAADDLCAFVHTGGTTGSPKVAAHTHANQLACGRDIALASGWRAGDAVLGGLPLFHVNALLVTGIAPTFVGARVVWPGPLGYRSHDLYARFWRIVEHYRITAMSGVPTVYGALAPGARGRRHQLAAHSRRRRLAAAVVRARGVRAAHRRPAARGVRPHRGDLRQRLHPLRRRARRLRRQGPAEPAGQGRAGRGRRLLDRLRAGRGRAARDRRPHRVRRLRHRPRAGRPPGHARGTVRDGWLDTGDLGSVDADGYVHLTGRAKDLIIRGGHNIDPTVIEEALLRHPSVVAAAAVGRPDRHSGEVPVAYVVTADPDAFDEAELLAWAERAIDERAARPKRIRSLASIPTTEVGKYFKPALVADAAVEAVRDALGGRRARTRPRDHRRPPGRPPGGHGGRARPRPRRRRRRRLPRSRPLRVLTGDPGERAPHPRGHPGPRRRRRRGRRTRRLHRRPPPRRRGRPRHPARTAHRRPSPAPRRPSRRRGPADPARRRDQRAVPGPLPARRRPQAARRAAPGAGRVRAPNAARPQRVPAGEHVPPARPRGPAPRPGSRRTR